jgi:6-pyruvoyl-tetrahydropterin synthase
MEDFLMYNVKRAYELLEKISFERLGGSKEEKKAAEILKEEIEKRGVKAYEEEFEVDYSDVKVAKLEVLEPYNKSYIVTGVKMSGCTSEEGLEAKLVYIEDGLDANLIDEVLIEYLYNKNKDTESQLNKEQLLLVESGEIELYKHSINDVVDEYVLNNGIDVSWGGIHDSEVIEEWITED